MRFVVPGAVVALLVLSGCAPTPTPPPPATDAQIEEEISRQLDASWDALGLPSIIPKPAVTTVELTTRAQWPYRQVNCVIAQGLPAHETSGNFTLDLDTTHTRAESLVIQWTCKRQFPVDPRTDGYLTEAQALYLYDYFVDRLAPCLELQGLDVPPAPARDSYVGAIRTGIAWNPYFAADGAPVVSSRADLTTLDLRCPPLAGQPYAWYRPFGRS
jgi:hypothetical protein